MENSDVITEKSSDVIMENSDVITEKSSDVITEKSFCRYVKNTFWGMGIIFVMEMLTIFVAQMSRDEKKSIL